MNEYVSSLESYLGIRRTEVSLSELWSHTGPEEERSQTLKDFVDKVCSRSNIPKLPIADTKQDFRLALRSTCGMVTTTLPNFERRTSANITRSHT